MILAQAEADFSPSYYDTVAIVLLIIIFIALLSIVYFESRQEPLQKKKSVFKKLKQLLEKSKQIEKADEIALDHDSDIMKDLDSKVPPLFSLIFYVTIIIAVCFMLYNFVFSSGNLEYQEYSEEISRASFELEELKKSGALVNEDNVVKLTDPSALQSGKTIYDNNCIACHSVDGGGLVGPNFTDNYWIHGGGIKNIFKTVKYGVPEKGMISWQTILTPIQIQEVSSYILTLQGTTPASAKEPEGDLWEEPEKDTL